MHVPTSRHSSQVRRWSLRAVLVGAVTAMTLVLSGSSCGATEPAKQQAHQTTSDRTGIGERARGRPVVLAISVDALNPVAIKHLGPKRVPNFYRLIRHGAHVLNARTEVEQTKTLPNHTGMMTGRRVNRHHHGHGIWFNTDRGRTVHHWAGHPVRSVFSKVHRAGRKTALFTTKPKFRLFKRSWPRSIDRFAVREDNDRAVVRAARRDLAAHPRALTFVHLSRTDHVGHHRGFMTPAYLRAVRAVDANLGRLLRTIDRHPRLKRRLTIVLTADHGGGAHRTRHGDKRRLRNYRIPFIVWGARAGRGNLYAMNPQRTNPRRSRPGYDGHQPIRNADLANVSTDLLGLGPVRGSRFDRRQNLRFR